MRKDALAQEIEALQQRITDLQQRMTEATPELLQQMLDELHTALEELLVAEEQLHEQSAVLLATQEELELERRRFADLFESAPNGYLITSARGVIVETNRAASDLLHHPKAFLVGKPLALFVVKHERQHFWALLKRLHTSPNVQEWEGQLQRRRDTSIEVSVRVAPVRDQAGTVIELRWLMHDMTARKQAEEQIRHLNAELEQRVAERTTELVQANQIKDALLLREQAARREAEAARQALQLSEERFRIALASSPVTVFHQDRNLRYTWIYNPYPPAQPEEIVGRSDAELFQPDDAARLTAIKRGVIETGVGVETEVQLFTPATPMWFNLRAEPLRDAAVAVVGIACAATNITAIKQAEFTIRRQAQLLEATFDAILVREVTGRIIYWNRSAETLYGFSKDEAIGEFCYELLRMAGSESMTAIQRALNESGRWEGELQHTTRDGRTIVVSSRQVLVREDDGSEHVIESNYDITERKRVEEQLRESEARFRTLADSAPVLIWMSGPDKQYTYVNKIWLSFTDRRLEQELGTGWLEGIHPDDRARSVVLYNAAFDAREALRIEHRLRRADGEYRWMLNCGIPRLAPDGAFEGYIGSCIDITDRKHMERVRHTLLERMVAAQEDERRRLSYELHDELGPYLTALQLGLSSLQELAPADTAGEQHIKQLQELTTRLGRDLHALARQLRPAALDDLGLRAALENLVEEWSNRYAIAAEVQSIGLDTQRLPAPLETAIYRVVQEALTNVARHAQARHVSVILERRSQHAQLIVEDDGRGFEAETLLHMPDTERGLGLIGMQERVAALGGRLTIESFPGRGTAIFVRIPISSKPEVTTDD
ncbi:MAG TPA: PAS domain S-box protein [Herpetosiphonaceae bacterium]